jgi:hypothetical protein
VAGLENERNGDDSSLVTLASSISESRAGASSSLASQDLEYKHWGRLDDPDSNLHVKTQVKRTEEVLNVPGIREDTQSSENDQLFRKQSFAKGEMEILSADESYDDDRVGLNTKCSGEIIDVDYRLSIIMYLKKMKL